MEIKSDYNLSSFNTFGIEAKAKLFVEINQESEITELFSLPQFKNNKKMFLGGGSNVLFTKDFDGIVILNKLKGIEIIQENSDHVFVRSMGGEIWHDLVIFCVEKGYWGIENLSLIPGTVGAAPMQNIGAYGGELSKTLKSVEAYNIESKGKKIFSTEECELGYRDSVFKNSLKNKYFITAITLELSKVEKKNLKYKILSDFLENNNITVKSSRDISDAVSEIRRSKLPDPKVLGNAGSFFKNVFLHKVKDQEKIQTLTENYPTIPIFDEGEYFKIPSAWLIEQSGWKGKREGAVGVHEKQALVIVNYGGANGEEVLDLVQKVIEAVKEKFKLELFPEVNIV
ncbi:MAG: UDP-N-acetylmuramate dehydrogenase [Candidatus Paceibacterota bacterium]